MPLTPAVKWKLIARSAAADTFSRLKYMAGNANSGIREPGAVDERIGHVNRHFNDYVRYGGLHPGDLAGARVMEIGPGDNLGVALRFTAAGARETVVLDKFTTTEQGERNSRIYAAVGGDMDRVRPVFRMGIEDAADAFPAASFDLIVSRAVLQEIHEIRRAFSAMDRLLRPGGRMIHKIDLTDYLLLSGRGFHQLEFLTIPEMIYRAMSRHSRFPNRERRGFYRGILAGMGYEITMYSTHLAGAAAEIDPHVLESAHCTDYKQCLEYVQLIRPRLIRRFAELPDDDLAVTGIFVSAVKPDRA